MSRPPNPSPWPAETADIVIVSDIHLRPGAGRMGDDAAASRDAAFGRFTVALLERAVAERRRVRVVLLGDTFDLPAHAGRGAAAGSGPGVTAAPHPEPSVSPVARRWSAAAVAELDRVARARPMLFESVDRLLSAGAAVDVVPGNHDAALQLPEVEERLRALLGAGSERRLTFHPWILHLPGLLYAEHGHQYHDINAYPMALHPGPLGAASGQPLWERIDDLRAALRAEQRPDPQPASSSSGGATRRAIPDELARTGERIAGASLGLVGELGRLSFPLGRSRRRSAYRREVLPAYAAEIGLPLEAIVEIDRLSEPTTWSIAARLARQALGDRVGSRSRAGYIGAAARAIHAILAERGLGLPVYAFGHSHTPALEALLEAGPFPRYANPGSWARVRPAELRRRVGPARFGLVWIRPSADGGPDVALLAWDDRAERFEPLTD